MITFNILELIFTYQYCFPYPTIIFKLNDVTDLFIFQFFSKEVTQIETL